LKTYAELRPKKAEPWKRMSPQLRTAVILGSSIPLLLSLAFWSVSSWEFIVVLFLVFLPLQILGGAAAGFVGYGRRGILDGLLVVNTLFLSAFVLVMLSSVIVAVFATGFEALSPHFFFQN